MQRPARSPIGGAASLVSRREEEIRHFWQAMAERLAALAEERAKPWWRRARGLFLIDQRNE
jgi:hypothetical protein